MRAPSPASRKCSRKSVSFLLPPRAAVASPDTEFQFDPSEFDFWRTFLGGLTLDAFASPATAQLSEFCSPANDFFNYNLRGHRIWAFPPFALVHRALRCIDRAVRCDSQTAALLLVPVRPRAPWWNLRSRFICLHRYPPGSHVLRRVAGKVVGPLFPSRSPLELWWLPPGRAPRATHVSAIKRAQRNIVTNMTNSKVKVDITVDDLRRSAFGNVGPPPSSDTSALMNADPGRDSPLDYSCGPVPSTINTKEFSRRHCLHCSMCKNYKGSHPSGNRTHDYHLHPACYGTRMHHYLKYGWSQVLKEIPPKRRFKNYLSIREHLRTVRANFDTLDAMGVFSAPLSKAPPWSAPLQAVVRPKDARKSKETGLPPKVRVCIDLSRNYNDSSVKWPFRYSTVDDICGLMTDGCYMACLDLRKFYLYLPLHPSMSKYHTFQDPRDGRYRQYRRVAFGNANAPAWASAVSSELCNMLRDAGVPRCAAYIDDVFICADTREECQRQLDLALRVIRSLGFGVAEEKIQLPATRQEYIGLTFDSIAKTISVSSVRRHVLAERLSELTSNGFRTTRSAFASLCGSLSWVALVMSGARTYMRRMWNAKSAMPRSGSHSLPPAAVADILWWQQQLARRDWSGSRIWLRDDHIPVLTFKSDASGEIGCGFHCGSYQATHAWSSDERTRSIAWKELYPVLMAARDRGSEWAGNIIRFGIDNTSVVYMINSGSSRDEFCMQLLRELADLQMSHSFDIVASWCPRLFNDRADALSRLQVSWTAPGSRGRAQSWQPSPRTSRGG